jgi:hypothetical protein
VYVCEKAKEVTKPERRSQMTGRRTLPEQKNKQKAIKNKSAYKETLKMIVKYG